MNYPVKKVSKLLPYPPRKSDFTKTFWEGLRDHVFQTTQCCFCEKLTFPPKPICPHCWSDSVQWTTLNGEGTLYSKTVVHAGPAVFKDDQPYRLGIVDLDEGLRIATRILDDIDIGGRVKLVLLVYEDGVIYAMN